MSRQNAKAALALICATMTGLAPVAAPVVATAQTRAAVSTGATPQLINLPRGTSFAVDLPADARDVIVSNPQVAEAMLHSPRRITVIGLAPGETDAVFLDAAGRTILAVRVRVDAGTSALQDTLSRVVPGSQIRAEAVNDSIILTGTAASPADAARAQQVARAFVSAPEKVLNMVSVAGSDQVTIKARVVEVQRSVVKQLGLDVDAVLNSVGDGLTFNQSATFGVNGSLLGGGTIGYGDGSLSTALKAFERTGLLRTLAEPNVTAVNGESGEFLAGGEFPVPVSQSNDDGGSTVGIEFKPFDVLLAADDERPIRLEKEGDTVPGSRFTYARGQLVLWSAKPGFVDGKGEVLKGGHFSKIAIANPKNAPYGAAAVEAMDKLGLTAALQPKLVTGESIGQTYNFIATGNAELGFVALAQVLDGGKLKNGSMWVVPAQYHAPIIQDGVILKRATNNPAAKAWMDLLKAPQTKAFIRGYGYEVK